mgnify:CR=1 FL=1
MGLSDYDARVLTESAHLADLFEKTAELSQNPKRTAAWFMGEVLRLIKEYGTEPEKVCFSPKHLAQLICMVEEKKVSPANAKKVFEHIFNEDTEPEVFGLSLAGDFRFLCYRKKGCLNCVRKPLQAVNALCNNGKDRTRKCCVLPDTITHQPEKT